MTLANQPTSRPTRKLVATAIAAFVVGGALRVADTFFPGLSDALPGEEWIAVVSGLIAGYMTRERA